MGFTAGRPMVMEGNIRRKLLIYASIICIFSTIQCVFAICIRLLSAQWFPAGVLGHSGVKLITLRNAENYS